MVRDKPDFKVEDVWTVARTLVADAVSHEDGDYFVGFVCRYCDEKLNTYYRQGRIDYAVESDFRHKPDCPVLVAQDLLTNAPEQ